MNDLAIRVENLPKLYRIVPREWYLALRDQIANVGMHIADVFGGNSQSAFRNPQSNMSSNPQSDHIYVS